MVRKREGRILQYLVLVVMVFIWGWPGNSGFSQEAKTYVGSETCKGCHEAEYKNFKTYAKKANSFKSVASMKKGLTEAEYRSCLECHTTGYGKPGGFRSEQETPHLKDAGCESCHGPGSVHANTQDPKAIQARLTLKECETCHSSERVSAFNYVPLIHGGAH